MSKEITQEGISQPEAVTEAVVENAPTNTSPIKEVTEDTKSASEIRQEMIDQERVQLNPRNNTLSSIIAKRKEQLKEEVPEAYDAEEKEDEVKAESDSDKLAEDEPIPTIDPSEQEEAEEASTEEEVEEPIEEPIVEEKFTLKVNGQDKEVSKDELIRMAQMADSATQKFQEAATMKAQAEALAQLRSQEAEAKEEPKKEEQPSMDDEELNKLVHDIQFGEGDAAKNALKKVLANRTPQPQMIDEMAIARQAAEQATQQVQQKVAFDNLLKDLGQEYPDVFADRNTTYLAAQYVHEMRAEDAQSGNSRSDAELFRSACEAVDNWSKSKLSKVDSSKTTKPKVSKQKVEAKRQSADIVKPSVASTASIGEDTPPPPTRSQVVEMMKKRRGQTF